MRQPGAGNYCLEPRARRKYFLPQKELYEPDRGQPGDYAEDGISVSRIKEVGSHDAQVIGHRENAGDAECLDIRQIPVAFIGDYTLQSDVAIADDNMYRPHGL